MADTWYMELPTNGADDESIHSMGEVQRERSTTRQITLKRLEEGMKELIPGSHQGRSDGMAFEEAGQTVFCDFISSA